QHETLTDQAIELDLPADLGDCALPTKIAIYRILQEALANGHRHSGAARQRVTVDRRGSSLALIVSDDGKGFDPQRVLASEVDVGVEGGHFGLRGIQDRVEMLGARSRSTARPVAARRCRSPCRPSDSPDMIRVLLADDHAIVLEGLRALLEGEPDIKVAAWTTDGTEVLKLVQQHKPDVVVLDLELTSIKGTEVITALRDRP